MNGGWSAGSPDGYLFFKMHKCNRFSIIRIFAFPPLFPLVFEECEVPTIKGII